MKWDLLAWQILLLVGVGEKTFAAKVQLGSSDAAPSRRQRGTQNRASPAPVAEPTEDDNSPLNYWFKTGVEDAERGFMQGRAETKRGDQVVGSYQYSDGHVKVKVVYAADDQGYRVLKEERVTLKPFADPPRTPQPDHSRVPQHDPPPRKNKSKPRPRGSKPRPKPPSKPIFKNKHPPGKYSSSYSSDAPQGLYLESYSGLQPLSSSSYSQQGYNSDPPELESLGLKLDQSLYQQPISPGKYIPASTEPSPTTGSKYKNTDFDNASYAVKLRTNHGTGFSHQGFNLNSGGSQRYSTKDGEPVYEEEPTGTPKPHKTRLNDGNGSNRWNDREEYNRWKDEEDSNRWNGEDSSGNPIPSSTERNPVNDRYKNHKMETTGVKPSSDHGTGLRYQFTSNTGKPQSNELKDEGEFQQKDSTPGNRIPVENGGPGTSHQGFISSPGKSQKYKVKDEERFRQDDSNSVGKPHPSSTEGSLIPDDDQFNHSLEENDSGDKFDGKSKFSGGSVKEIPRGKGNNHGSKTTSSKPKKPKSQPIPVGPVGPESLAIFVKDPPIDPSVVLFRPQPVPKPVNRVKKRRTIIRVRRPLEDRNM